MKPWTVLCQLLQFFSLYITPDVYLAVNAFGSLKETGTGFLKRLFFFQLEMYYVNVLVFGIQHFYYVLLFIILLTRRVVAQEVSQL